MSEDQRAGIFNETPEFSEIHPVNYIKYFCEQLRAYRRHLDKPNCNAQRFCVNILEKYTGSTVHRNRIARLENGNVNVEFSIVAAYISDMNAWPEVIQAITYGESANLRYVQLVQNQLKSNVAIANAAAIEKINKRVLREHNR